MEYRLSTNGEGFDPKAKQLKEIQRRIIDLRLKNDSSLWVQYAHELANILEFQDPKHPYPSIANPLYMRERRDCVIGNVYRLLCVNEPDSCGMFTVVRQEWATYAGDLFDVDPKSLLDQFRQDVRNEMRGDNVGWLFAAIEASFDPKTNCYQFHIHGVATDRHRAAIDKLRKRKAYQPWEGIPGIPDCKRPILITRQPLTNLPSALGYILKPFWKLRGPGPGVRLPPQEHVRALLWLHRQRLQRITLMMGLSVRNGQILEK
ncbi:hypothetical protein GRI38_10605 [Altererythrobacter aurantiacus]|uniref:Uncharacterized protein n=1 Tax=Parapontixanthobacter aurantiacus TaxID=1463599 RepID=A0A844ZG00_9SPHN|nr:hypothetical protein [Parapontixanthobacter aurantiacus]MXO86474.1 hypothetical protein [Parapontixanthobacter aurantiacus]